MAVSETNSEALQVLISMNPKSGASDRSPLVFALAEELKKRGMEPEVLTDIEELGQRIDNLYQQKQLLATVRCVVAAGGDGTVSLLANRLPAETPLAVFPLGTENLLAKFLGIQADPVEVAELIERRQEVTLDAGRANGKLFLVMASCGFDADVVKRLHAARKGHIRHWSYALPVVNAIRRYRYPTIQIDLDDGREEIRSKWAFAFNVPRYAMNLPIASEACSNDGLLDLCTFRGGSLVRGLFYLFAVVLRKHHRWTNAKHRRFRKLVMKTESEEPVPFQLDGDPGGHLPLEIEVLPGFLKMLVPGSFCDREAGTMAFQAVDERR